MKEDMINRCVDYTDFNKVARVMEFLDWKWFDVGVPLEGQLRQKARELATRAYEGGEETQEEYVTGTGGIFASYHPRHKELKVWFELAGWTEEGEE